MDDFLPNGYKCSRLTTHRSTESHITWNASDSSGRQCSRSGKLGMNTSILPRMSKRTRACWKQLSIESSMKPDRTPSFRPWLGILNLNVFSVNPPTRYTSGSQTAITTSEPIAKQPNCKPSYAHMIFNSSFHQKHRIMHPQQQKKLAPTLADVYLITCGS